MRAALLTTDQEDVSPIGDHPAMSTLPLVTQILRRAKRPLHVTQILKAAGDDLPSRSKKPDTVVSRDLAIDIKQNGEDSLFVRTGPGVYALRQFADRETKGTWRRQRKQ